MSIIESKNFSDVLRYADGDTLVLLDVDNTLIEPISYIGGTVWFDYMFEKLKKQGANLQDIIKKTHTLWVHLQYIVKVKAVEQQIPSVIKQLQDRNIKIMGLTARSFILSESTDKQLKSVGISLDKNTIYDKKVIFTAHAGFYRGVLSIEPFGSKGERLLLFLKTIKYFPKKVLFVDDLEPFLEDVNESLATKNISFTGIRYGAADDQHIRFDPARADEELRTAFKGTEHEMFIESVL